MFKLTSFLMLLLKLAMINCRIEVDDIIDYSKEGYTVLDIEDELLVINATEMFSVLIREGQIEDITMDPIMMAGSAEGDIKFPAGIYSMEDYVQSMNRRRNPRLRNAIAILERRWPNAEIPYQISSKYGTFARSQIAAAIRMIETDTCVRFIAHESQADYISIEPISGCESEVGRSGGKQDVSITAGCLGVGTIAHELMHTLGFFHEHTRPDRDDHVKINWENINVEGTKNEDNHVQFQKVLFVDTFDEPYDYDSLMHYDAYEYSKDPCNLKTIEPLTPNTTIGQRKELSAVDIRKINKLYKCHTTGSFIDSTEVTCRDSKDLCAYMSHDLGWCDRKQTYMMEYCPISCGLCGVNGKPLSREAKSTATSFLVSTTAPAVFPESTDQSAHSCMDKRGSCTVWAQEGYCDRFPHHMNHRCPKSCRKCDTGSSGSVTTDAAKAIDDSTGAVTICSDKFQKCARYKKEGLCSTSQAVRQNCAETCRLCHA